MSRIVLKPKLLGATVSVAFDFISDLAAGETISSPVVTATVYSGVDASPSSILSGGASVSGTKASQLVKAGVVGTIYELLCRVTTSLGQTLNIAAYLAVTPDLP